MSHIKDFSYWKQDAAQRVEVILKSCMEEYRIDMMNDTDLLWCSKINQVMKARLHAFIFYG